MSAQDLENQLQEVKRDNEQLKQQLQQKMQLLRARAQVQNKRVDDNQLLEEQFKSKVAEALAERPARVKFKTVGDIDGLVDEAQTYAKIHALQKGLEVWQEYLFSVEQRIRKKQQFFDSLQ